MTNEEAAPLVRELHAEGWTRKDIAELLEISTARIFRILFPEKARASSRESVRRYVARNSVSLCDVPKEQIFSVYVHGDKPRFGAK